MQSIFSNTSFLAKENTSVISLLSDFFYLFKDALCTEFSINFLEFPLISCFPLTFTDYVLVYEDAADDKPQPNKASKIHKHEAWRKKFMTNLAKAGLLMEEVNARFS